MASRHLLHVALLLTTSAVQFVAAAAAAATTWERVLLTAAAARDGAVCIDGSPAAVYVKPGSGADVNKWILFFEGGGWCFSAADCYARSKTALGSSKSYPQTTKDWADRDLLDTNCTRNPHFCNYSSAYARYCDGASRSGDVTDPVVHNGTSLYYRGIRVLRATLDALTAYPPSVNMTHSMANASELLISGSSAGGLTTYLHADYIADAARAVSPGVVVKAIPEVGFFIDAASIWDGARITTDAFARVAAFANVTGGAPGQVNPRCVAATPPADRYKCFMAQYTYPYIATPVFVVNSAVDEYQTQHILAPDPDTSVTINPYKEFLPCTLKPQSGCNATQHAQWSNYSYQFKSALDVAASLLTPAQYDQNGGFITSCPIHTTMINQISHKIHIGGVSMYEAVASWYFGHSGRANWTIDVDYPGDKTCPLPSEMGAVSV